MADKLIAAPYSTDVVSAFDIYKPDVLNKLFMANGNQGQSFQFMLFSMGMEVATANKRPGHYEDTPIESLIRVNANVAAPGAGNDITFRLHADMLDGSNRHPVRLTDVVMFPGFLTGSVIDITQVGANVDVTVSPSGNTAALPALTAGQYLTNLTNGAARGSGQPRGLIRPTKHFEFPLSIVNETITAEGSEMTHMDWFNVREDGAAIPAYYALGLLDGDFRQSRKESGALLFQNETTNAIVDPTGVTTNNLETMIGLIPQMQTRSLQQSIAADTYDIANLYDAELKLTSQNVYANYVALYAALKRHHAIELALKDFVPDSNIEYARRVMNEKLFNNNDSLAATMNYKMITIGEKAFCIKRLDEVSNPDVYNFTGSDAQQLAFMVPLAKQKDSKNVLHDHVSIRYASHNGYNRRREMWSVGGAGNGKKETLIDARDWAWRAEIGLQGFKLNQCILITQP